ncbi:Phosphoribosylamine--glycine ligase, chloroplastic [Dionaea muscipula]
MLPRRRRRHQRIAASIAASIATAAASDLNTSVFLYHIQCSNCGVFFFFFDKVSNFLFFAISGKKMIASQAQIHLVGISIFRSSPSDHASARGTVVSPQKKMMKQRTISCGLPKYSIIRRKLSGVFEGELSWKNWGTQGRNPTVGKKAGGWSATLLVVSCAENADRLVEERLNVLVIGGGGREHALCYALQRSPSCAAVFCAPGNDGISRSRDALCIPDLDISDSSAVFRFCLQERVGLVVVGPEAPLVAGLANDLMNAGIPTFGPSSQAAALEGSKNFMKSLCDKYGIPTAKYRTFTDASAAKQYAQEQGAPIVVKADGLAAGKGVIVAMTLTEAYEAIDSMLVKCSFGSAGRRVVIEEYLEGEEASFFAIVDGENAIPLESAQDHKRVGDGDTGPNTGGMGAYSPAPVITKELQSLVMKSIILPTVNGMAAEGCKFVGVLFAGLMIEKKSGLPKLIEFNVRFGDPECQVLMMRLESDLAQVLLAACKGELKGLSLDWSPGSAMVVVMASNGYPEAYEKGSVVRNIEDAENVASSSVKVFHAGTALNSDGNFVAVGGRVLGVTAKGNDLQEARDLAYLAVEKIDWPAGFYRRDIGWRALPQKQSSVGKKTDRYKRNSVILQKDKIAVQLFASTDYMPRGMRSKQLRAAAVQDRACIMLYRSHTTRVFHFFFQDISFHSTPQNSVDVESEITTNMNE